MNHFEELCKYLLERENYWVRTNVKVDVTKEEKASFGKPTSPRPEMDIVAYRAKDNRLLILEVKSFLNSSGVHIEQVRQKDPKYDGYKILTGKKYQKVVSKRLISDFIRDGLIKPNPKVQFGLIAGKISKNQFSEFYKLSEERDWFFWGPKELKDRVIALQGLAYEDNPFVVTSKVMRELKK